MRGGLKGAARRFDKKTVQKYVSAMDMCHVYRSLYYLVFVFDFLLDFYLTTRAHTRGAPKGAVTNGGLAQTQRLAPSLQVATTDRLPRIDQTQ